MLSEKWRKRKKKAIISVKLIGVKNTEESDAIIVLKEMDRHQTYMNWKENIHISVRDECFGITYLACDTKFEISSEVEKHEKIILQN